MDAVVTGVEAFGVFVQGLDLPAEGLLSLESLPHDTYRYERASHSLTGRRPGSSFRLGDRIRVVVARVDLERRTLDFRCVEGRGRPVVARPPKPAGRPRSGGRGAAEKGHREPRKRASGKPGAAKPAAGRPGAGRSKRKRKNRPSSSHRGETGSIGTGTYNPGSFHRPRR
jgi:ribonuclease R